MAPGGSGRAEKLIMTAAGTDAKVALVTGATSGIGKAIADRLIREGFRVVLNGRSFAGQSGSPTIAESPTILGPSIVLNSADLLDERTPQALLDSAVESFGRLHYVFVNAGTIESAPIETIDIEKMCTMLRLKVESSFRLIYTVLKHMKKQGYGHVFITSSVLGTKTRENSGANAAGNHALEALAESLRMELSDTDIQITCIEPGLVSTNLHRDWPVHPKELLNIGSALTPEDIADAVWDVMLKKDYIRIPRLMILPRGHRV